MDISQKQIRDFMGIAGQICPAFPTVPNPPTRKLRVRLTLEELLEFADASGVEIIIRPASDLSFTLREAAQKGFIDFTAEGEVDLVGIADGMADIKYVNEGAANAYGIDLQPIFEEVHDSNMSKRWTGIDIRDHITARGGKAYYGDIEVTVKLFEPEEGAPEAQDEHRLGVYDTNGKFLKSPSYRPANVKDILAQQRPKTDWLE